MKKIILIIFIVIIGLAFLGFYFKKINFGPSSVELGSINILKDEITVIPEGKVKKYDVQITEKSSWEENKKFYSNIDINLKNNSSEDFSNWKLVLYFSDDVEIKESWSGNFEVKDNTVIIKSIDYNKIILNGKETKFGGIFYTDSKIGIYNFELYELNGDEYKLVSSMKNEELVEDNEIKKVTVPEKNIEIPNGSPLNLHGKLSVKDGKIVDKKEKEFLIQGISTHSISEFGDYINIDTFKTLRDEFNVNTIRVAMYTEANLGYTKDLHQKVNQAVNYATELGMYVILDWHILGDSNPNINKESAKEFFSEMATNYAEYDNVLYEICNEPNGDDVTWDVVKEYANEIIALIRNIDKDGIIIIGTPNYCRDLDSVIDNQIAGDNLLYAFHFYSATHQSEERDVLKSAVDKKLPVIVSEFGLSTADGNGELNKEEAENWLNYLRKNKIGYVCWNLSNKDESSALLLPSTSSMSSWTDEELSEQGLWIKEKYNN